MIDHLRDTGGDLDYMDVSDLVTKLTKPWEVSENPATKFARDDKYERQLMKAGLPDQQALRLSLVQAAFKATGELYNFWKIWAPFASFQSESWPARKV